uniref:DNA methyltransferase n=1 Tax=Dendroctonus ponderosae TaxID=77166 RepID=A0AAR5PJA6_DENPD
MNSVLKNTNLSKARSAKNDEFYTQYVDIEKEMNAYLEFDSNVFRDKVVLLPCDDPEWSLKKLISTSYAPKNKQGDQSYQPSLFEEKSPQFDSDKSTACGKFFELESDITKDGVVDINDIHWQYLKGDGDFRSDEVKALRDQADIIVTNPPFSLFRDFIAWIME